jgi:GTPase SAR1 family protein
VTDRKSFNDLLKWIEDLREFGDKDTNIIIAGNKSDMEEDRNITFEEASELAKKFKIDYVEVSARTGLNVKILFELLSKYMVKKYEEPNNLSTRKKKNDKSKFQFEKYKNDSSYSNSSNKSGCCS